MAEKSDWLSRPTNEPIGFEVWHKRDEHYEHVATVDDTAFGAMVKTGHMRRGELWQDNPEVTAMPGIHRSTTIGDVLVGKDGVPMEIVSDSGIYLRPMDTSKWEGMRSDLHTDDPEQARLVDFHGRIDDLKRDGISDYPPLGNKLAWDQAPEDRKLKAIVWESMTYLHGGTIRGIDALETVEQNIDYDGLPEKQHESLMELRRTINAGEIYLGDRPDEPDDPAMSLQAIAGLEYDASDFDRDEVEKKLVWVEPSKEEKELATSQIKAVMDMQFVESKGWYAPIQASQDLLSVPPDPSNAVSFASLSNGDKTDMLDQFVSWRGFHEERYEVMSRVIRGQDEKTWMEDIGHDVLRPVPDTPPRDVAEISAEDMPTPASLEQARDEIQGDPGLRRLEHTGVEYKDSYERVLDQRELVAHYDPEAHQRTPKAPDRSRGR